MERIRGVREYEQDPEEKHTFIKKCLGKRVVDWSWEHWWGGPEGETPYTDSAGDQWLLHFEDGYRLTIMGGCNEEGKGVIIFGGHYPRGEQKTLAPLFGECPKCGKQALFAYRWTSPSTEDPIIVARCVNCDYYETYRKQAKD